MAASFQSEGRGVKKHQITMPNLNYSEKINEQLGANGEMEKKQDPTPIIYKA